MKRKLLSVALAVLLAVTCIAAEPSRSPPYPGGDPRTGVSQDGIANVRDHGAKGDGRTDDTAAFQAAVNSLDKPVGRYGWSAAGGVVEVTNGRYLVKGAIDIPCGGICIRGTGSTSLIERSCWIEFAGTGPLFRFPHDARSPEGFLIKNILLIGQKRAESTAFELWTGPDGQRHFRHGMTFEDTGVYYFGKALTIRRKSGGGYQVGHVRINRCSWSICGQVVVFEGATSGNRISISNCMMRQCYAGMSALDLRVYNAVIRETNLEGNPFAVLIRDSDTVAIRDCYSEGVTGELINVVDSVNVKVEGMYLNKPAHHVGKLRFKNVTNLMLDAPLETVVLEDCRNVTWPAGLGTWRGVVSTEKKK